MIVRLAWSFALVAAFILVIDAFVCGVYRVDSGSMEPTLHGPDGEFDGERVLVFYDNAPKLERFDLVVFLPDGEKDPIVKRVVGLPGESVQLSNGDLLINAERLKSPCALLDGVLVFDDRELPMEQAFPQIAATAKHVGDVWDFRRDKPEIPGGDESCAEYAYQPRVFDGYRTATGRWVEGSLPASDLTIRFEFLLGARAGSIGAMVTECGDAFAVKLAPQTDGRALLSLLHSSSSAAQADARDGEVVAQTELDVARDEWHTLELANVDNTVTASVDARNPPLAWSYERNAPYDGRDEGARHRYPRAGVKLANFDVALRHLQLSRGIEYTHEGKFAVAAPCQLGPDEIFVLGDNSSASRDSRSFGPVKISSVIGRPGAVVWPWRSLRRLSRSGGPAQTRL